jgi:serine/alanine adding enzyme
MARGLRRPRSDTVHENVELIPVEDRERWLAAHARDGLPTQSWGYAHGLAAAGRAPVLAVVEAGGARMLLPFVERDWHGHVDIATPLGLSGASFSAASPAPLALWREYAAGRGWVAGYLQLAARAEAAVVPDGDTLSTSNRVFVLDLDGDPIAAAGAIVRRKIRRAEAAGVRVVDDRPRLADALVRLYPTTVARTAASSVYAFPEATLRRWCDDPAILVLGAERDGGIESVALFPTAGQHAEYSIVGSSPDGRDWAARLIAAAVERLRARGGRWLDLGGGVRAGDSLYDFKQRFHGIELPLRAARQIYDMERYERLCAQVGVAPQDGAWFPAYRARVDARPIPADDAR